MSSPEQKLQLLAKRQHGLQIWALGLGYFLFYAPYSGLTKALSTGLLSVDRRPVSGTVLLPIIAITTLAGMLGFITAMKWWNFAGRREIAGVIVPFPRWATFGSGVCLAIIMGTTTLAFTFGGLSIVLVLVLLRGGILIIGPLVDAIAKRRVRWFSWAALLISLTAVMIALADATSYQLTLLAVVDVIAYLSAYFFKLRFMSRLAKCDDRSTTLRYFVEEQMVAAPLLVLVVATLAVIDAGSLMHGFRVGLSTFLLSSGAIWAAAAGLCYAGLCICTTMIFLDRRENTFCIPMHCGSSMLAGFSATAYLSYVVGQGSLSTTQAASGILILVALGFLSPLHHLDRVVAKLRRLLRASGRATVAETGPRQIAGREAAINHPDVILFVCSGNTCRSPMAATIAKTEIAARFGLSFAANRHLPIRALSAGISARIGARMSDDAKEALRELGFEPNGHRAQQLTPALASRARKIFCMTESQRIAVTNLAPAAALSTLRLDPSGDIEDPMGSGVEGNVRCARRLQSLVKMRLDELFVQKG